MTQKLEKEKNMFGMIKKVLVAFMILSFSATAVEARPNGGHNNRPHNNRPHNSRPNNNNYHHTTNYSKGSRSRDAVSIGILSGILGLTIGNEIIKYKNNKNTYVDQNSNNYIYIEKQVERNPSYCETTVYDYGRRKVTNCYNNPRTREVVYVNQ